MAKAPASPMLRPIPNGSLKQIGEALSLRSEILTSCSLGGVD